VLKLIPPNEPHFCSLLSEDSFNTNFGKTRPVMIGKTISHYRVLEKLGQGGMGVAQDLRLDRFVVLKLIPTRSHQRTVHR